jgi:hypothetical protein
MSTPSTVVVVVGVAVLAAVVTAARRGRPGPKRTYLYETDDSEQPNPFGDLSEGAEHAGEGCQDCGDPLESGSFRYCLSCLTRPVADD